jgi:hypothetical protein
VKLKIGYLTYTVSRMSKAEYEDESAWGLIVREESSIRIWPKIPAAEQARVLIHEVMHGCYDLLNPESTPLDEEGFCHLADRALATVFLNNPELLGMLHQALSNGKAIV